MLAREIAGGRWQVVHRDTRKCIGTPLLWLLQRASRPALKPQDRRPEDPARLQEFLDARLDGPEVLANDESASALGFESEDPHQRLVIEGDVGTLGSRRPVGDPPLAEEPEDVVDPDAPRVPEHGAQHVAVGHEGGIRERIGQPRRLRPVLAELVVHIGRAADGDSGCKHILQPPRIGAVAGDADGEVVDDPRTHADIHGRLLRLLHLLVQDPLHPQVTLDAIGVLCAPHCDFLRRGMAQALGPLTPHGAVLLRQSAPGGEVDQARALALDIGVVSRLAPGRERDAAHDVEGGRLGDPDRITVEQGVAQPAQRLAQASHRLAVGTAEVGVLRDLLDPQVDGVGESSRRRQIGRRGHGHDRGRGVQWVDQQEVGTEVVPRPCCEIRQIREVTDPPGSPRPHRVDLGHETPEALA